MRTSPRRHIALFFLTLFLLTFVAGCSSKGVHMPKHRKRRHCDCPTFSEAVQQHNAGEASVSVCWSDC